MASFGHHSLIFMQATFGIPTSRAAAHFSSNVCFLLQVQLHVQYLKHFSRPFTVTGGDEGGMHIYEPPGLEKCVGGMG